MSAAVSEGSAATRPGRRRTMIGRGLAVVAYVALIFTLSSWSNPPPGPEVPHVDKVAHAIEYGFLGFLLAWAAAGRLPGPRLLVLLAAVGLVVAVVDEMIQSQTPGREASLFDVLADLAGLGLSWAAIEAREALR